MAKLTTKQRNKLPKSSFGMPGERKYPMPDASHAANAKARASQQFHKGNISKSTEQTIFRKADAKLKHHDGSYDRHLGAPHSGHHSGHVGGHGEVDGMKGHKGHTGDHTMEHMTTHMASPQNKKHIMKHGGKLGQHPYGGHNGGNHSFHNLRHPKHTHADKMAEG